MEATAQLSREEVGGGVSLGNSPSKNTPPIPSG